MHPRPHETPEQAASWPETVPEALQLRLLDAMSYESCSVHDLWDEVRDWLTEQGAMPPAGQTRPSRLPAGRLRPAAVARARAAGAEVGGARP